MSDRASVNPRSGEVGAICGDDAMALAVPCFGGTARL
jgi:hypothetical protein